MRYKKVTALILGMAVLFSALALPCIATNKDASQLSVLCFENGSGESICYGTVGKKFSSRFLELFIDKEAKSGSGGKGEKFLLIPSGNAFGVKIHGCGVRVTHLADGFSDNPLSENDKIDKINGERIFSTEQVKKLVCASGGAELKLEIIRDGKHMTVYSTPKLVGADYSLGVLITDGASGIGTITYINPATNQFGGLGHGICDSRSGEVLNMNRGEATTVILGGAVRGEAGAPGELRGVLTEKQLGTLESNTECGVFGTLTDDAMRSLTENSTRYAIAGRHQVHEGEATIISTVKNGRSGEYKITITDIDRNSDGTKSFRIKVTDEALIAMTGGIVRGMGV